MTDWTAIGERGRALGYRDEDLERLKQRCEGGPMDVPVDLRRVIDGYTYLTDWRADYRIQSVSSSLRAPAITCIDGAVLSYGLLELLFPETKRRLLAIHRRDPKKDEECGHCVALYWEAPKKVGSFSKSSFKGLGHRDAVYPHEPAIATTYGEAYIAMEFVPLYFGITTLEAAAPDLDWRHHSEPLNEISDRLQATYEYGFMIEKDEKK